MENRKRNEAILNEYKGALFEYLTGQHLACLYGIEADYIDQIPKILKQRLKEYERSTRLLDIQLWNSLPKLSCALAEGLYQKLQCSDVKSVCFIGQNECPESFAQIFKEADLLIRTPDSDIPLSIKMCKMSSYVNTKSGGIRTFLEKYFLCHETARDLQIELNILVDQSFQRMGHELYALEDMLFSGVFDDQWEKQGFSNLPGELPGHLRQIVLEHYHELIVLLHEKVKKLSFNKKQFENCLMPLFGMGLPEMVQGMCFYEGNYQLKKLCFFDSDYYADQLQRMIIHPVDTQKSSFEIELKDIVLQIRIKPMNKFTVPGHKINCSVKY